MAASDNEKHVAYLEDADDGTGSCIEGTRKYATQDAAPDTAPTPRQRPNVGRLVTDPPPSSRRSPTSAARQSFADSESAPSSARSSDRGRESDGPRERRRPSKTRRQSQQSDPDREKRRQDRLAREEERNAKHDQPTLRAKEASNSRKVRPAPLEHAASQPVVPQTDLRRSHAADDAQRVQQQQHTAAPHPTRPRAQTRPATYYGGQPPYAAPMAWPASHYVPHPYYAPPMGQQPGPPQVRYPGPAPLPGPMGPPSPSDVSGYYGVPLSPVYPDMRQRFDPRGSAAMPPPPRPETAVPGYGPDDFGDEDAPGIARRPSRPKRREEDRRRMPPPPQRPMSAMPQSTQPFHPPSAPRPQVRQSTSRPPTAHRRSVGFADDFDYRDFEPSHERFQDISPEPSYDRRRYADVPRQRRDSQAHEKYDVIPASGRGRRASMYGTGALGRNGVNFEQEFAQAKFNEAMAYQEDIGGGPTAPLTAETLRKATRVPSSRSTRSSGSRDESEHRRSYTTGITRASSNAGNEVTIKVDGAILTVPAGAEITLSSRQSGSRYGSDRASTVYQLEDGRGRPERQDRMALPYRSRAPSQADSHGRGYLPTVYSQYEQVYADGNYI